MTAIVSPMDDDILSINPDRGTRTSQGLDPYVMRLPDGHVRVTAESIVFPETCPKCGAVPANTRVRLKGHGEGGRGISIPYCKRCGWALNVTQYLFIAVIVIGMFWIFPHLKLSSRLIFFAIVWGAGWLIQLVFQLVFKPDVAVVDWTSDSIDLSFENQVYAEKFVEMNR